MALFPVSQSSFQFISGNDGVKESSAILDLELGK
jgi:hypothetical protein